MTSVSTMRIRSRLHGLAVSILIAGASASCAVDEAPDLEADVETGTAGTMSDASLERDLPTEEERDASPFRNFPLPPDPNAAGDVERHPVRIANRESETFVVRASAGAAPVVLDTLEPGESYRVDLEAPAGTLRIEWRSLDGRIYGDARVQPVSSLLADSVSIVRIEADDRSS